MVESIILTEKDEQTSCFNIKGKGHFLTLNLFKCMKFQNIFI